MGKTHKKTHRRQESIKRARHSDRRMKIGAIVLCAAIAIITFVAVGMQLLVPVTEAALIIRHAQGMLMCRRIIIHLPHLKWIQKKSKTAQRLI